MLRILLFSVKITQAKYPLHKCKQSGWSFLCRTLQGQIKDHLTSCTASQHLHANSEIGVYYISSRNFHAKPESEKRHKEFSARSSFT